MMSEAKEQIEDTGGPYAAVDLEYGLGDNDPTKRTPATAPNDLPFSRKFLGVAKKAEEVFGEVVLNYQPSQCFTLVQDYRRFLVDQLNDLAEHAATPDLKSVPEWISGTGEVGSKVKYAIELQDVVYWVVEEVTQLREVQR